MPQNRSESSIIQSRIDIKSWQQRTPTVAEARPAACPSCMAASNPVGGRIQLHGHGLRERQVCGPPAPGEAPALVVVAGRRYRCVCCGAVLLVVPRGMLARRRYSASAIGFALALWGLVLATAAEVRRLVNPMTIVGLSALGRWATLRRWARAVGEGRLLPGAPRREGAATLRQVAASAASALAARAAPTTRPLPIEHRAFVGAAHAA
jgi:hypothetical protein